MKRIIASILAALALTACGGGGAAAVAEGALAVAQSLTTEPTTATEPTATTALAVPLYGLWVVTIPSSGSMPRPEVTSLYATAADCNAAKITVAALTGPSVADCIQGDYRAPQDAAPMTAMWLTSTPSQYSNVRPEVASYFPTPAACAAVYDQVLNLAGGPGALNGVCVEAEYRKAL